MTDRQWIALKEMTQRVVFECEMSLGKVRLQPSDLYSYELIYPSHIVTLHKDDYISSVDAHYLRSMYNEWLSRI